ncbi:RNA polymerase II-associated factor 1 homolog [Camellia sinensis]|uniref:RNA polymerase II-associated factor 1 homolog n=1 Tax=Camellia sinensis TaxID=4442 RepID=UPI0010359C2B|nr:RNA polymerase II-associated factor 1 homolog [Camellia sinensis]
MKATEKFTFQEMIDFTRGWDADCTYRVHRAGPRTSGFPDRDGAEEHEPAQPLQESDPSPTGHSRRSCSRTISASSDSMERETRGSGTQPRESKGTHDKSGPSEPALDDDDDEIGEDEEAANPQSESSEDRDDDADLDSEDGDNAEAGSAASSDIEASDSGTDGDCSESMPMKRTKRASRS